MCSRAVFLYLTFLFVEILGFVVGIAIENVPTDVVYGVVIDAGSTGSRVRVYNWNTPRDNYHVPEITESYNYKIKPDISAYANNLEELDRYIESLIQKALVNVPEEKHGQTSIYLMATAGMRLLLEDKANAVIDEIDSIFKNKDITPFAYKSSNARILSGEEEGVFAWISVNYLRGFFDSEKADSLHDAGILEMGGASTQITFMPEGSILANKFPVKVGGKIYPLYSHSYLYYGQDYAKKWVREKLYREDKETDLEDPCMLQGDVMHKMVDGVNVTFNGIGNPAKCWQLLKHYVYKPFPHQCYPKPCAVGTVYQPSIDPEREFIALSAFRFAPEALDVLGPEGQFTPARLDSVADEYCGKTKDQVMSETSIEADYVSEFCLMGKYIPHLLTYGYDFDKDTQQIKIMKKINGKSTGWSLGAIIYENSRGTWTKICNYQTSSGITYSYSYFISSLCLFITVAMKRF